MNYIHLSVSGINLNLWSDLSCAEKKLKKFSL